jgi:hypothetical protein
VAEELGTSAYLSMAPNHTYIKQWSEKTGWFNTELTNGQFPIDSWIMASGYINLDAIRNRVYMDTLSPKQSLAVVLTDLAQGYQRKFPDKRTDDFVSKCLALAIQHYPQFANALILQAELFKSRLESQMLSDGLDMYHPKYSEQISELEKQYFKIHKLGYRMMPKEMYLNWLMDVTEKDQEQKMERFKFEPPQPFANYGHKVKVSTLSGGKYQEFFDQEDIVQIGTVLLDRFKGKIVRLVPKDTSHQDFSIAPDIISRWISIDPLAHQFYSWSPYNFVYNNPMRFTDPTGMAPVDDIYLNEKGREIFRLRNGEPDRTFLIKTVKNTNEIYTQTEIANGIAGNSNPISRDAARQTETLISQGNLTGSHMENLVQIENQDNRRTMANISQDNGKGGTTANNNREFGGYISDGIVTAVPAGPVSNPKNDPVASISFPVVEGASYFHDHPSGTIVERPPTNVIGGSTITYSFMQGPSNHDISESGANINYVFGRGSGTVYIYNDSGVVATLPLKKFVTPDN